MKRLDLLILSGIVLLSVCYLAASSRVGGQMLQSARHFLASLDVEKAEKAQFQFLDEERKNWHYVPRERVGLPLKEMTPGQRKLAHSLLATALSSRGLQQAEQIMYLDRILYEIEGQNPIRDPDLYFFSIFGSPSSNENWGWRVEGHHLSLNLTLRNGDVASTTPAFFGSNPARVPSGPHEGLEVLAEEQEIGLRIINMLTGEHKTKAIISEFAPRDIVTEASVRAEIDDIEGLPFLAMDSRQRELLERLIHVYAERFRPELAAKKLAQLQADGMEKIRFAWAGGLGRGEGHYYRIHGPRFVIEFDNTQNDANHVHSVWRDFENDFGEDLLHSHYHDPESHHHAAE